MTPDEFKARVHDTCRSCFTSAESSPVNAAVQRISKMISRNPRRQETQYRVLRDLVEDAARADDYTHYGMMVAVHDLLLRTGAFRPPGDDHSHLLFFDEQFYVETNEDVASAMETGVYRDGFHHFVDCGCVEGRIAHPWRSMARLAPAIETKKYGGRNGSGRSLLGRVSSVFTKARRDSAPIERAERIGINLIGFHSANLGLGVSARAYRRFLLEAGLDVCAVELPVPGQRSGHDTSYADEFLPLDIAAPHPVNLFLMNPKDIADHLVPRYPAVQTEGKINVALPFWELARLPETWIPTLEEMDIVVAASSFIEHAMMMDLDSPIVRRLDHPLYIPDDVRVDRERWNIPPDTVAFVCSFEMASDINRKNPLVGIQAFEQALGGDDKAMLIVKINNAKWEPRFEPLLERLRAFATRNPNIRILDEVLTYTDVMSLFASCDVLVSLHRAEGLGLCLMEAMTLGKPVIATAWSGNMSFTTEQNSCLVSYDLVPVQNATQEAYSSAVIRADARWADARVEDAAHWMKRLVSEPELRTKIGRRAAADMADYQNRIDARELVVSVRNLAARRGIPLD